MTLHSAGRPHHDITRFSLVQAQVDTSPGYALRWDRAMQALMDHGGAFVPIRANSRPGARGRSTRRPQLAGPLAQQALGVCCKAGNNAEVDDEWRAALATQSALAEKAFGIPIRLATTLAQPYAKGLPLVGVEINP